MRRRDIFGTTILRFVRIPARSERFRYGLGIERRNTGRFGASPGRRSTREGRIAGHGQPGRLDR
jgi:hypothetical protein